MVVKKQTKTCLLQIHKSDTAGYTTLGAETYAKLFLTIDKPDAPKMIAQKPLEYIVSTDLTEDISPISKKVQSGLTGGKGDRVKLIIEMLDDEFDAHEYDILCEALHIAISSRSSNKPCCICVAVSYEKGFRDSVILNSTFIPI